VILLDAQALIALALGETAMDQVRSILRSGSAAMTAVNASEVFDVLSRRRKISLERVAASIEPLFEGPLRLIPVDLPLARRAAQIRGRYYHRTRCSLSLADTILLAAAQPGDEIATADSDVLAVAAKLGIATIELPRSA